MEGEAGPTRTGVILGTPSYMAPEQARAEKGLTTAVDVYALGAILYQLLTGRPPFRAATDLDTVLQVLEREPVRPRSLNPETPRDLETICLKCLEKDPSRRYDSAAALADDLDRWLRDEPILARPASACEMVFKWARRRPAAAALFAVSSLGVAIFVGLVTVFSHRLQAQLTATDQQRKIAEAQEQQAMERELLARRYWYGADMNLAQQALEAGNSIRLVTALERQFPQPGQQYIRGFEWHYLWRLCHRQRVTLKPDAKSLGRARYSPDGRLLAIVANRGDVQVWDTSGWKLNYTIAAFQAGTEELSAGKQVGLLAFSPDGEALVLGIQCNHRNINRHEPTVQVWHTPTGRKLSEPKDILGSIEALAFSRDGKNLHIVEENASGHRLPKSSEMVTGVFPINLNLWSWPLSGEKGQKTALQLRGWLGTLTEGAFAPEGNTLVMSGLGVPFNILDIRTAVLGNLDMGKKLAKMDGADLFWDAQNGNFLKFVTNGWEPGSASCFSADGKIKALRRGRDIELRDLETGMIQGTIKGEGVGVRSLALAPDGATLASGKDGCIRLWDVQTGRLKTSLFGHVAEVHTLLFSPTDPELVSISSDGAVKVWSTSIKPEPLNLPAVQQEHDWLHVAGPITMVASPDGSKLITAQLDEITSWEVATGKPTNHLQTSVKWPLPIQGPGGGSAQEGEVPEQFRQASKARTRCITDLAISPDGRLLATKSFGVEVGDLLVKTKSFGIEVWDLSAGRPVAQIPRDDGLLSKVRFTPDGQTLLFNNQAWDTRTWQKWTDPLPEGFTDAKAFSPDGSRFLTTNRNPDGSQVLRVHNMATGTVESQRVPSPSGPVRGATFSPRGHPIVLIDRPLRLWMPQREQQPIALQGHTQGINDGVLSPDGQTFVTAGADGNLIFWDPETGQERLRLREEELFPQQVVFSPKGQFLAVSWTNQAIGNPFKAASQAIELRFKAARDVHSVSVYRTGGTE